MIDIHFHCLPGIDDGPFDLAEAVAMCRAATEAGCRTIVATPHQRCPHWWNSEPAALQELHSRLREAVGDGLRIELGAEIRIGDELLQGLEAAGRSGMLSLASSRYLLLEFGRQGPWIDPGELVHELKLDGWMPIFAHPEFIPLLASDLRLMERLTEAGAMFQLTAMSLTGAFGQRIRKLAQRMMDASVIHFVASDAHDTTRRPPGLRDAYWEISRRWGEETAWNLTTGNPNAVVENQPIAPSQLVSPDSPW